MRAEIHFRESWGTFAYSDLFRDIKLTLKSLQPELEDLLINSSGPWIEQGQTEMVDSSRIEAGSYLPNQGLGHSITSMTFGYMDETS